MIRLSNTCSNCENLKGSNCTHHQIPVSEQYTCDSFSMQSALKNSNDCTTCSKFHMDSCANPQHAGESMRCAAWNPRAMA